MSKDTRPPDCPKCGNQMRISAVAPRFGTHPEITSYSCAACGEVLTKAEDEGESLSGN